MAEQKFHAVKSGPRVRAADQKRSMNEPKIDVPDGMTSDQTTEWVGGDRRRAEAALKAEKKIQNPRTSLIAQLERLVNNQTGAGIGSGEA